MSADRSTEIKQLCELWRQAVLQADGSIAIGGESEKHRLRNNGIQPHDLTFDEVRAACVGLTSVLLLPGLNTVVDQDHEWFWAWAAEVLLSQEAGLFDESEGEIRKLVETTIRAALAWVRSPIYEAISMPVQSLFDQIQPMATHFLRESHLALSYLAFPALEAVLRKKCSAYISYDGRVTAPFQVGTRSYKTGDRCSSLLHVLRLFYGQVASQELCRDLDEIRVHLGNLSSGRDGFELLYEWRNSSLHGESSLQTIGGSVLSITMLIGLDAVKDHYAGSQKAALERINWMLQTPQGFSRAPWAFYPPYF